MFIQGRSLLHKGRHVVSTVTCLLALAWSPVPGLAGVECLAFDSWDFPRNCTFTEMLGQCLWEATQSRNGCIDHADGLIARGRCHFAFGIDFTACIVGSPLNIWIGTLKK